MIDIALGIVLFIIILFVGMAIVLTGLFILVQVIADIIIHFVKGEKREK